MSRTLTYWALVTVKNGENTIAEAVQSIFDQTVKPSLLCIVDDGSTDSTPQILSRLQGNESNTKVITLADKGYDSRRIVHNWNVACDYVRSSGKEYDFLLISSDDVVLPKNYVQKLIEEMDKDPKLVVISGSRGLEQSDYVSLPEGAGRLIRISFFKEIGYRHPPYYGYEPWILYKALQSGYNVRKLAELEYDHNRTFGVGHKFIEYGPAMRCLGYHPLFVLARVARNIVSRKTGISSSASMRMLFDYFYEGKWKDDPYFHYHEDRLRLFVRSMQKRRLLNRLSI